MAQSQKELVQAELQKILKDAKIDGAFSIDDHEALPILYDLIQNEGLSLRY